MDVRANKGIKVNVFVSYTFVSYTPIFNETHEVMQSVIHYFTWYKVSYMQWNKVSYNFCSDVEWHTQKYNIKQAFTLPFSMLHTQWKGRGGVSIFSIFGEEFSKQGVGCQGGLWYPWNNIHFFVNWKKEQKRSKSAQWFYLRGPCFNFGNFSMSPIWHLALST